MEIVLRAHEQRIPPQELFLFIESQNFILKTFLTKAQIVCTQNYWWRAGSAAFLNPRAGMGRDVKKSPFTPRIVAVIAPNILRIAINTARLQFGAGRCGRSTHTVRAAGPASNLTLKEHLDIKLAH